VRFPRGTGLSASTHTTRRRIHWICAQEFPVRSRSTPLADRRGAAAARVSAASSHGTAAGSPASPDPKRPPRRLLRPAWRTFGEMDPIDQAGVGRNAGRVASASCWSRLTP
jgi:hypothetical protein